MDVSDDIDIEREYDTHSNDTSHDNRDDTLHHEVGSEDGHGGDANS